MLAHEIRNPLSSIKGAAQFLLRDRPHDPALQEFLAIILEEVDVMNRVTTDFLEFSHRSQPTASYVNRVDVVLQRTLRLLAPNFKEREVRVLQDVDPNISEVLMESIQLEQVLRNIILNALEAMPEGGTLTIISRQDFSRRQPEVAISIRDTGQGIPSDQVKRIFDRSFTTKTRGAGIGLSIVREIVDNHGGRIQVDSQIGAGTTFTLYLPATRTFARSSSEVAL
jgi:signal transduction histidine kinase